VTDLNRPEAGHDHDDEMSNHSSNTHFNEIVDRRYGRREMLKGSLGLAMTSLFAAPAALATTGAPGGAGPAFGPGGKGGRVELGFTPIPTNRLDTVTVPPGYRAQTFLPWGTPITGSYPAYRDGGLNTGAEQAQQMGMHHDGMHYFPFGRGEVANRRGILCINHEYIDQNAMHPNGATLVNGNRTVADEVLKEINAHGVSVVEVRKGASGDWELVRSVYNRRITAQTPMEISGPARGYRKLRTRFSPAGTRTRGTINNCAHGYTPWGTYLTCEENWAGYFSNRDPAAQRPREHTRYGVSSGFGRYRWETVTDTTGNDTFRRFDARSSGASETQDYRNEPNCQGWVVEIDPFNPTATPVKRTALGRFAHEGAWLAPPKAGKQLVWYQGDDAQNEYIYKFVTRDVYNPARSNGSMLDNGTLYVARFNANGTGDWLALDVNDPAFVNAAAAAGVVFENQADVLVNTRLAADVVGATKMDRSEWGSVHPHTGEVYMTLTNNSNRSAAAADAANPRGPNPYGHIIRWREDGNDHAGLTFQWDIFAFGGPLAPDANGQTGSAIARDGTVIPLTADNIFASPDGLWIDQFGICWIQTDMSGSQLAAGPFGNNQMLAADTETGDIRRFFVGPPGCEVTGVVSTNDGKSMFVNVQHPGEGGPSSWPNGGRPRSATVVVTKVDGGIVGT
jgi:secreted PhoX family phosphatase